MRQDAAPPTLAALFGRFLRFGLLAFGGPVAQIGMIKRELVDEGAWLTNERFNRLLAIYQLLPGPEAHELCVHLGMMQRGRVGGVLAGLGFMLPGLVFILILSWLYGQLDLGHPLLSALLLGVQIGAVALITRSVHRIGAHVLADRWLWMIALICAAAALLGVSFWVILPIAAACYPLASSGRKLSAALLAIMGLALGLSANPPAGGATNLLVSHPMVAGGTVGAPDLFLTGLKAGMLTFGGAYTAIPFVRDDTVGRGWVSEGQFLDGLALSGIIPAPLIIFATFVGFQAGGFGGALAITAGMFLPAFGFTLLFFDRLERVIEDQRLHRLLAGVAAAVVGLIAATTIELGVGLGRSVPSLAGAALIFAAALTLLYVWRSSLIVPAAVLFAGAAGLVAFA